MLLSCNMAATILLPRDVSPLHGKIRKLLTSRMKSRWRCARTASRAHMQNIVPVVHAAFEYRQIVPYLQLMQ